MKYKNKVLAFSTLLALSLGCVSYSIAQSQPKMGVKGGLNVSNLYIDNVDDENARFGFSIGLYGQLFSSEAFALQPELLYSTKGSHNEFDGFPDQTFKFNLNYLDLPVLAVFKLGESAEIHAGGYASYLLNANISYDGDLGSGGEDLDRDNFKTYDYGLVGGVGFNFGAMQVGARYNYGLVKIADSNNAKLILGDAKNSVGQVYLAFNLNQ